MALFGVLVVAAGVLAVTRASGAPAPPAPTINPPLPATNTTVRSATLNWSEAYGSNLSFAAQAMQGDAKYSAGDYLNVGFEINMPGQHPPAKVTLDNSQFVFAVSCRDGSTPSQSSFPVSAPSTSISIPANDGGEYPSGGGAAASTYQGSVKLPSTLCGSGAGNIRFKTGATYTALLSSTDTADKVQVQWHYVAANSVNKGSNIDCSSLSANPNPGLSICNGGWSGTVAQVPGTAQSSISFVCKLDSAATFTACGSGSASGSISYGPLSGADLAVGNHTFQTEAVVAGSTSASASYTWTIIKNSPTLGLSAPASGTAGTAVSASSITATLGGAYTPATGAITFSEYGPSASAPSTCPGSNWTTVGAATVSGSTTSYQPSNGFTPNQAGNYWLYASYGGDTNNNGAASPCPPGTAQKIVVGKSNPMLAAAAPASGKAGTKITAGSFSAALSAASGSNASGTITFTLYGPQATAPAPCAGGSISLGTATVSGEHTYMASADFTPSQTGTYWLYASYGGDRNNNGTASACPPGNSQKLVVASATPTLSVSAPATLAAGGSVAASALTATLSGSSGANANATITFKYFGPSDTPPSASDCATGGTTFGTVSPAGDGNAYHPTSGGFTPDTAGTYWWYVSSPADANNNPAVSPCNSAAMTKTVVAGPSQQLTIDGDAVGLLYPGGAVRAIAITFHNPNDAAVDVQSLTVTVSSTGVTGCATSDFHITQSNITASNRFTVPKNAAATIPATGPVSRPTIQMSDNGEQDACKNAHLTLTYSSN